MSFKSTLRLVPGWRESREAAMGFLPEAYFERVQATGPIAYFPQWELAGGVSTELINGWDGAYTGVSLDDFPFPNGDSTPRFDGVTDFNDIFTAQFQAGFDGAEGSTLVWGRVFNVGVWTDGVSRRLMTFRVDGNNRVFLGKSNVNNTLLWTYRAGGVSELLVQAGHADVDWFSVGITWSASTGPTGEVLFYFNGLPQGAIQVGLGVWAGNIIASHANIGCRDNTVPDQLWNGWLAHGPVWDRPITPAEMLSVGRL